ncbi:recombination-associated protein RdgC [Burkholderia ubonensis]|uniref:Recombination-associated protein RdgC n=1 Tax=Burkholderia ubonensis TaxID=101571 RepID=A0ABD4DZD3_9BURK|nr:recombination-associated protein RdgC [Burkholderia ubonensis]KVN83478.1 hypothetical protein WJ68_16330 [Burkholderia ubonensis]
MWFRNLTLYSFASMPGIDALNAALARQRYAPCTDMQKESSGFVAPHGDNPSLAFSVDRHMMLALCIEKKVLPAAVVRDELATHIDQVERQQGFKVGKRQKKEIREDVTDALLSQAFSVRRTVRGWIDPDTGLIALDTSSQPTAELFVRHLIRAVETDIGLRSLNTTKTAVQAMTEWVAGEPPVGFTIDDDTTFAGSNGAAVKYSKVSVEQADVARQLESGKHVTSLALTHADRLSFVLSPGLVLRRIAPLDVLKEPGGDSPPTVAADFLLMAATLAPLVRALIDALDGIKTPDDLADEPSTNTDDAAPTTADDVDPLTEQARQIVIANGRASISLVQLHLRIGYNRAARLLEELEKRGVVSAMNNSGMRAVLIAKEAA